MKTRQTCPRPDAVTIPVYAWRVLARRTLRLEGPLSRPPGRRRRIDLELHKTPEALRTALQGIQDAGNAPLMLGRRVVQIFQTAPNRGFLLHLTRQHSLTRELATYVQWLEEGIDSLPEAFVLYDADDRLLIANSQYSQLYPTIAGLLRPGITFREIAKAAVERGQFRHADGADAWLKRRIEFHDRGEGFFEQHLSDGRWIQLSERRTRSGGVTSIRADITLLKDREDALRRAMLTAESTSRSMARFLATFSHEVRNGLNGIAGLAQMLALDAESQSQRSHADLMLQSTKRLTTVLADLLDYLKNEAIGIAVKLEAVDPRSLLEILRAELEPQAAQRGIALRWKLAADVPACVLVDSGRILQVLANLAGNALKYAPGGEIAIGLSVVNKKLRFEVEDQGIGIAPEDLRGLFEYFVQTGARQPSSTGLGLAICKQLVVAMGGVIGVDSQPGRGSRFWFDLPLRVVSAAPEASSTPLPSEAVAALRVGIVDDDPLNRTVAEAFLLRLGCRAVVFENGQQIVKHMRQEGLDVLLLDLMMPKESGFEIAARLRRERGAAFSRLILVAITGNVVPDSLAACREAGIDAILQKPLFLDQLQNVLNWAARTDRSVAAQTPEIFTESKVAELAGSAVIDPGASLAQLAEDIGVTRFAQSVRAARKLIEQLMLAPQDDRESLCRLAHRVAGSAPQLGFGHLGDCARTVETLLGATNAAALPRAEIASHINSMRQAARESLAILDEQLRQLQHSPSRVRRR